MKRLLLLALLAAVSFGPVQAHALRLYRCAGYVQYHPCTEETAATNEFVPRSMFGEGRALTESSPRFQYRRPEPVGPVFAEIVSQELSQVIRNEGIWRGVVRGNGQIRLQLEIDRGGQPESSLYMGSVTLANKSTWFAFRSTLPSGSGWNWRVTASAS